MKKETKKEYTSPKVVKERIVDSYEAMESCRCSGNSTHAIA